MATNNNGRYPKYRSHPGKNLDPTGWSFNLKFWLKNLKMYVYKMSGKDFMKNLAIFFTDAKNSAQKFRQKFDACGLCEK